MNINLPVEASIIIVSDYTIIGYIPKGNSIFHTTGLQKELDKISNNYRERRIPLNHLEKLITELLHKHWRKEWKEKVNQAKLRKGVLCKTANIKVE